MKVTGKVSGLAELRAALSGLPRATARGIVRRVLIRRATPMAATARALVPVDTGALQSSIAVTTKLSRRHRRRLRKAKSDTNVHVGASGKAHLQEFGTRHHAPQPFMRPAFDAHKGTLVDQIRADMWVEIKRVVLKRAAKRTAPAEV